MKIENPFAAIEQHITEGLDMMLESAEAIDTRPHPWNIEEATRLAQCHESIQVYARVNAKIAAAIPKLRKAHARAVKAMGPPPGGKA